MKQKLIKVLKIALPLAIGIYLSWYFFAGLTDEQLEQTLNAFYDADYFWIILSLLMAFLSHVSRAYRWRFLLGPMGYKIGFWNGYHAVMSGYIINLTVPRSGEVARAGLVATYEKVPFEKGFATIVVERVIDVLMFGGILFIAGIMQADADQLKEITATDSGEPSNLYYYIIIGLGTVLLLTGYFFYRKSPKFRNFMIQKITGFVEGLRTIWTMKKKWAYLGHTLFIWTCYVGMIWVSAQAFEETKDMPVACVFGAFVVGAAAIGLFPGGIGAYPAWIYKVLILYNIDFAAFGIFVWVVQTGLIVALGLLSLFLIQRQASDVIEPKH